MNSHTADNAAKRDAGLRRLSRLTRGALAGGVALTGVFSAVAARSFAGHTSTTAAAATPGTTEATTSAPTAAPTTAPTTAVPATRSTTPTTAARTTTTAPLQSPVTTPRSSSSSASHVTSGGS